MINDEQKVQKDKEKIQHSKKSEPLLLEDLNKSLKEYLQIHPEEQPIIDTEIYLILQKKLKEPVLLANISAINADIKPKLSSILDKILKITGFSRKKHQIHLRNLFDKSSNDLKIPFPILTRKTEDARLQWAFIHWDKLEPYLIKTFHPNSEFSYEKAIINP